LITVFSGWKVVNPQLYLESLNEDKLKAEAALEPMIRNSKNALSVRDSSLRLFPPMNRERSLISLKKPFSPVKEKP
jgi:hypothetical protein